MIEISKDKIDNTFKRLDKQAESSGYHLNPDESFTKDLIKSLLINGERYGYWACPCRLSDGKKEEDLDIICPCDYRDPDLDEFGTCYCSLYVSQDIKDGKKQAEPIPERRPSKEERIKIKKKPKETQKSSLSKPVWRCKVCGYLCGRDQPPEICPICKAKKDRFELFMK
jgi:ferredoxin-thioredoxin reductase catalytic subunit